MTAYPSDPQSAVFRLLLQGDEPILALAPMQDVTDLRFMRLIRRYGDADIYLTEYFRVLPQSRLDPQILSLITNANRNLRNEVRSTEIVLS